MSFGDAVLATLSCLLFVVAAFVVSRGLRSANVSAPRPAPKPREEDLVWPSRDADGNTVWATQDELPWHEIVEPPLAAEEPDARRAG
jgi:hypothetical protein